MACGRKLPFILPDAEAQKLIEQAGTERDRLILLIAFYMGLRVSEICKLEVTDVDFEKGFATLREAKGGKDRNLPLPDRVAEALKAWLGDRTVGYVFPSPKTGGRLSTRAVQLMIKRVARRAGLPDAEGNRKYTPHKARHWFATALLEAGVPLHEVSELLGHSSVAITQVYLHARPERLRTGINKLNLGGAADAAGAAA